MLTQGLIKACGQLLVSNIVKRNSGGWERSNEATFPQYSGTEAALTDLRYSYISEPNVQTSLSNFDVSKLKEKERRKRWV